ncbi:ABC transporter, ATP-binding protein [Lachnospiraceae bacterium KM106-2]|nr:ABC transporter, ATP-binding protein [Lachnospiraceae bacterium KM106-2]
MLQIKDLTISHKKDLRTLISNLSFVLNDGDKAVIIGEEGNGKSTLMKLIYDESLVSDYVDYTGQIIKNKMRLGYVAQELPSAVMGLTVYEYCEQQTGFYDMTPKDITSFCSKLKLPSDFVYSDETIRHLSGGEKMKLQFISLLLSRPDALLLDEPSNDIDLAMLEWLEQFIQESKLPILYISHDETLIERTANKIIHIEQLKRKTSSHITITKCNYRTYVQRRQNAYFHQEQVAKKERSEYKKQQDRYLQIRQKIDHKQNAISRQDPHGGALLKKKMHSVVSIGKRFEKKYENMTEIPETEDAIFFQLNPKEEIPNGKQIISVELDSLMVADRILTNQIKLSIKGPEKIVIIGKNGIGKSTLLKKIAAQLLERTDLNCAYMPQNYEDLLDLEKTPVEFLSRSGEKEETIRICTYLGSMKYTADEMTHQIAELSGGQKAKLLFLKMSLEGNNVLILDEPTRNFSPLSNPVIRGILKEYKGVIISISHDRKYIEEVCDKVYELTKDGLTKIRG